MKEGTHRLDNFLFATDDRFRHAQSIPPGETPMAQMLVLYKTPKDAAAFDKHYAEKHIPIAKKLPGLRKYELSNGPVVTPAGPSPYHLVATLSFDNLAALQSAFGSAEGRAAGADVPNFATGGADVLIFDTKPA
jgi:uncharacterized protein (TIGR02118 family)